MRNKISNRYYPDGRRSEKYDDDCYVLNCVFYRTTYIYDELLHLVTERDDYRWGENDWQPSQWRYYERDRSGNLLCFRSLWQDGRPYDSNLSWSDQFGEYYAFSGNDITVHYAMPTEVAIEKPRVAEQYSLDQNYPNPFNPATTIKYQIPSTSRVTLTVFDILGREVATLVNEVQDAGFKSVQWEAGGVASGVYLYRLQAGSYVSTRKLVLMK
jgi:hypothetical protein